nr:DsrE family protein [Campylobacter sp.]
LEAFMQIPNKPYAVILVNNAVKLTTDRAQPSFKALKNLEAAGVKILSCGSCLEAYGLVDKLGVGEMTNAFEVIDILSKYEEIKL